MRLPRCCSISSRAVACGTVSGNPSRRNPLATCGEASASSMMPLTSSSGTNFPASISALAFLPSGVPSAAALRRMSPVESWGIPNRAVSRLAWVPFPAPGGPRRMTFTRPSRPLPSRAKGHGSRSRRSSDVAAAADAGAARPGEALVVARDQVALDLLHRIEGDADHDQQRGAAELERHVVPGDQDAGQHADRGDVDRAAEGDAREHVVDVIGGLLAGPDSRDVPAVLLQIVGD